MRAADGIFVKVHRAAAVDDQLFQHLVEQFGFHAQLGAERFFLQRLVTQAAIDSIQFIDGRIIALEEKLVHLAICVGVKKNRATGQAIPTGAANLLVIRLEGSRKRGVDDGADVGLVDSHSEGDGSHHRMEPSLLKFLLHSFATSRIETGVVGGGRKSGRKLRRQALLPVLRVGAYTIAGRRAGSSSRPATKAGRSEGDISTTSMPRFSRRKP